MEGVNIVVGKNGQGKTNLVEAVYLLAGFGSHRTNNSQSLIGDEAGGAEISAEINVSGVQRSVGIALFHNQNNVVKLDGKPSKLKDLSWVFNCVMFSPDDLNLVRGQPSYRRRYLDQAVCRANPGMWDVYASYERVLKQRNSLLKTHRATLSDGDVLEVWTQKLIELGTKIIAARKNILGSLGVSISDTYSRVAGTNTEARLIYNPEENLAEAFNRLRKKELEDRVTLVGPHRDSVETFLDSRPTRDQSSQGEAWSLALAMKLFLASPVGTSSPKNPEPVLVLDDIFAHLDAERKQRLAREVSGYKQVLITTTEAFRELEASQVISVSTGEAAVVPEASRQGCA